MGYSFEPLWAKIIEAAIEVDKVLGPGFLESVYHRAPVAAFDHREIAYEFEKEVHVVFEGVDVGVHFLDLVIGGEIVVELKAVKALEDIHFAQVRSYLKATGLKVGLLLNFNSTALVVKRVVLNWQAGIQNE